MLPAAKRNPMNATTAMIVSDDPAGVRPPAVPRHAAGALRVLVLLGQADDAEDECGDDEQAGAEHDRVTPETMVRTRAPVFWRGAAYAGRRRTLRSARGRRPDGYEPGGSRAAGGAVGRRGVPRSRGDRMPRGRLPDGEGGSGVAGPLAGGSTAARGTRRAPPRGPGAGGRGPGGRLGTGSRRGCGGVAARRRGLLVGACPSRASSSGPPARIVPRHCAATGARGSPVAGQRVRIAG